MENTDKYGSRGVSSEKADVKNAIRSLDKGLFEKSFCKIMPDITGDSSKGGLFSKPFCNVMHADGAGTKAALAYLYWKETGDKSVWRGIAQDAVVMNTDDMLCVGITNKMTLTSTIGRNKFLIPGEVISEIIEGTEEFLQSLREEKIDIYFAGGETADVGDIVKTVMVDATVFSRIKKSDVITNERIQSGDVIIGLSSSGQTKYEKSYNSGIGSNGLTFARHEVLKKEYATRYPESFDANISDDLVYSGNLSLTDPTEVPLMNVGQMLLSPTRTYLPVIKAILENFRPSIHGIIHCTGGGQTKVLNYVNNLHIIKNSLFPVPPVFKMIQSTAHVDWKEMYQVFNMGHRMELYVKENIVEDILKITKYFNVDAQVIGHCESAAANTLTVQGDFGILNY